MSSNRRQAHAEQILEQANKQKSSHNNEENMNNSIEAESSTSGSISFREQYDVIREDVMKLRTDLQTGYDMIKDFIDSKLSIRQLLKR